MLKTGTALVVLFLLGSLMSCKGVPVTKTVAAAPTAPQKIEPPRFQIIGQAYGLALDTKSGLLCKTFAMDTRGDLPLCVDLSQDEQHTIEKVREMIASNTSEDAPPIKVPKGFHVVPQQ